MCQDNDTEAHVNCNKCGNSFHIQCLHSCHENTCPFCSTSWKPSNDYIKKHDFILLLKKRDLLTALKFSIQKARMNFEGGKYLSPETNRIEYLDPREALTPYQSKFRRCLDGNLQIIEMEIFINNVCYYIIDRNNK